MKKTMDKLEHLEQIGLVPGNIIVFSRYDAWNTINAATGHFEDYGNQVEIPLGTLLFIVSTKILEGLNTKFFCLEFLYDNKICWQGWTLDRWNRMLSGKDIKIYHESTELVYNVP